MEDGHYLHTLGCPLRIPQRYSSSGWPMVSIHGARSHDKLSLRQLPAKQLARHGSLTRPASRSSPIRAARAPLGDPSDHLDLAILRRHSR